MVDADLENQLNFFLLGERMVLLTFKTVLIYILSNFKILKVSSTPKTIEFDPKTFVLTSTAEINVKFQKLGNWK